MKKLLLSLLVLLSISAFGQDYKVTLNCDFAETTYKVEYYGEYLVIDVFFDNADEGVILIPNDRLKQFYDAMVNLRDKFFQWKATAIENNVTSLDKYMPNSLPLVSITWSGNTKWWAALNQKLTPKFKITDDGRYAFVINKKVTATENRFITDEFYFVLTDTDFNQFIDAINLDTLKNASKKQKDVENLFN